MKQIITWASISFFFSFLKKTSFYLCFCVCLCERMLWSQRRKLDPRALCKGSSWSESRNILSSPSKVPKLEVSSPWLTDSCISVLHCKQQRVSPTRPHPPSQIVHDIFVKEERNKGINIRIGSSESEAIHVSGPCLITFNLHFNGKIVFIQKCTAGWRRWLSS